MISTLIMILNRTIGFSLAIMGIIQNFCSNDANENKGRLFLTGNSFYLQNLILKFTK